VQESGAEVSSNLVIELGGSRKPSRGPPRGGGLEKAGFSYFFIFLHISSYFRRISIDLRFFVWENS
jgi:hypothetical protein